MTRTKVLFTPFKDPEREFRSSLSLEESRSPDFDLISDQEEYSEEEVVETMTKTMEQYMSKTRADYGSGISRPKIKDKDSFELKGQFLKELRDNTSSGLDHEDANEHIEKLRRDQVDDLMATIKEGEAIKEFRARNDARMNKMECNGNNVVGVLMNIPIFVGTFSVLTDFAVLEDMDAYRDEGIGDVIIGKPFIREVRINVKRFEGMITIHNGNEEATYQMAWSHPRFKHHTNEQCNKILPLLKVSEEDKMNGITHSYQKLKGFYKGVLNLGPEYV
nr:homeodomain-like protein [Tanacetum cinerariifolium]